MCSTLYSNIVLYIIIIRISITLLYITLIRIGLIVGLLRDARRHGPALDCDIVYVNITYYDYVITYRAIPDYTIA